MEPGQGAVSRGIRAEAEAQRGGAESQAHLCDDPDDVNRGPGVDARCEAVDGLRGRARRGASAQTLDLLGTFGPRA